MRKLSLGGRGHVPYGPSLASDELFNEALITGCGCRKAAETEVPWLLSQLAAAKLFASVHRKPAASFFLKQKNRVGFRRGFSFAA